MPGTGLEPVRGKPPQDFKSCVSASSTTPAIGKSTNYRAPLRFHCALLEPPRIDFPGNHGRRVSKIGLDLRHRHPLSNQRRREGMPEDVHVHRGSRCAGTSCCGGVVSHPQARHAAARRCQSGWPSRRRPASGRQSLSATDDLRRAFRPVAPRSLLKLLGVTLNSSHLRDPPIPAVITGAHATAFRPA
jgi:hypothetical protein